MLNQAYVEFGGALGRGGAESDAGDLFIAVLQGTGSGPLGPLSGQVRVLSSRSGLGLFVWGLGCLGFGELAF